MTAATAILRSITLAGIMSSLGAFAQQPVLFAGLPDANAETHTEAKSSAPAESVVAKPTSAPGSVPNYEAKFERWVDLRDLSFSGRYRNEQYVDGFHGYDNGQQRSLIDGAFKFDREGKYRVGFHISSGKSFNLSYTSQINPLFEERSLASFPFLAPVQIGALFQALAADPRGIPGVPSLHSRGFEMYFRQLYMLATPVKPISIEFGSFNINHGVNTEATSYDDDGYISGERVLIHAPTLLHLDEVSFTNAYEGDIYVANFFNRAGRLKESNYRQAQAVKAFGSHVNASADYTFDQGTHTLRQAALIKLPKAAFLDRARVELYQRLNDHVLFGDTFKKGQGMAVTLSKTFDKRFLLEGGYADIDLYYGVLTASRTLAIVGYSMNGDSFLTGERFFARSRVELTPYLNLFGYYTHEINKTQQSIPFLLNGQGITGGMTFDIKKLIFPGKVIT